MFAASTGDEKFNLEDFNKEPTTRLLHLHHAGEGYYIGRRLVVDVFGRIRRRIYDRFPLKFKVECGWRGGKILTCDLLQHEFSHTIITFSPRLCKNRL